MYKNTDSFSSTLQSNASTDFDSKLCDSPKVRGRVVNFSRAVHTRTVSGTEAFATLIDDKFNPKSSLQDTLEDFNVGDEFEVSDSDDNDFNESDDQASSSSAAGSVVEVSDGSSDDAPAFVSDAGVMETLRQQRLKSMEMLKSVRQNAGKGAPGAGGLRARRLQMVNAMANRRKIQAGEKKKSSDGSEPPPPELNASPIQLHENEALEDAFGQTNGGPNSVSFNDYRDCLGKLSKARASRIVSIQGLLKSQDLCAIQLTYSRLGEASSLTGNLAGQHTDIDSIVSYNLSPLERIVSIISSTDPNSGHITFLSFETTSGRSLAFGHNCYDPHQRVFTKPSTTTTTGFTVGKDTYFGGLVSLAGTYSRQGGITSLRPIFAEWTPATLLLLHHQSQRRFSNAQDATFEALALATLRIRSSIGFNLLNVGRWVDDNLRDQCRDCDQSFSFLRHKHNCR